jgi:hypothetical protein
MVPAICKRQLPATLSPANWSKNATDEGTTHGNRNKPRLLSDGPPPRVEEGFGELLVEEVERGRPGRELLGAFADINCPNEIGPGVYDIHSPQVPTHEGVEHLLTKAMSVLSPSQLWVNPDCGLKTRRWEEVKPALATLVETTRGLRQRLARSQGQASSNARISAPNS